MLVLPLIIFLLAPGPVAQAQESLGIADVIRIWETVGAERDVVRFIGEYHVWFDLSEDHLANLMAAGMPRSTVEQVMRAIHRNNPDGTTLRPKRKGLGHGHLFGRGHHARRRGHYGHHHHH